MSKLRAIAIVLAVFLVSAGILLVPAATAQDPTGATFAAAVLNHAPDAPADADIVKDFGLDPFYERFWGTLSVIDDNKVKRSDGGSFNDSYIGRKLVLKFADTTRYPGLNVAGYYTIRAVTAPDTVELAEKPDAAVQNEAGYIYADNELKFRTLLDTALNSGKVYKVSVPKGKTFVLLGPYEINNTKGGVYFFSEPTPDPCTGGADFKFLQEEAANLPQCGWFNWKKPGDVGEFDIVFENINLVARDSYAYKLESHEVLFALPYSINVHKGFTLKIAHCNFAREYHLFKKDAMAYLARRFGDKADLENLHNKYYLAVRPPLIRTLSMGRAARPFIWHLEHVDAWYTHYYTVSNTLFNSSTDLGYRSIMRHVTIEHGRNGILRADPLKPLVNISADADGDFTVMTIPPDSPVKFDFTALGNMYDKFSFKRPDTEIFIDIDGVTEPETAPFRRRYGLFVNQAKNRNGSAAKLGKVKRVLERGDGVFDLLVEPDNDALCNIPPGGFERNGGVIQYDYICSDRNGALVDNETSEKPTAMINRGNGYPNDYRGWVRYNYGDPTNDRFNDGLSDFPTGGAAWIWLDHDTVGDTLKVGDKLYMVSAPQRDKTVIVEAGTDKVRYLPATGAYSKNILPPGTYTPENPVGVGGRSLSSYKDNPESPAARPAVRNNKYLEINGNFYEYKLAGAAPALPDLENSNGYFLDVKGLKEQPGTYLGCNIWYETVVKKVVEEPGVGTRVLVWAMEDIPGISIYYGDFFPPGVEARPKHPANPPVGKLMYGFNVKTGNRKDHPGGKPFAEGETIYAYYLGTGADQTGPAVRVHPNRVILPKEWELPAAVSNAKLNLFTNPQAEGTHWIYGKHHGIEYEWNDVSFHGGNLTLIIRDGGSNKNGSTFTNCDLNYGGGMQLGGPLTIDGGKYKVYNGDEITVKNHPEIYWYLHKCKVVDADGKGWQDNDNHKR
jgi:hypothetical protein